MKSDHNILYAKFSIEYRNTPWKQNRYDVFNLKNPECQAKFSEVTNNSLKLKKCFNSNQTFPEQCNTFFKVLDDSLHQCFKKVKVGKGRFQKKKKKLMENPLKGYAPPPHLNGK